MAPMKSRLKLITPSRSCSNRPESGCLFRYSFGNTLFRWGRVVDRCELGESNADLHLVCFYNVATTDPDAAPDALDSVSWDEERFALQPFITNERPWREGYFGTVTAKRGRFDLDNVCVKSPVTSALFTLDGEPIPMERPHVGVRGLFGLAYIEDLLLEAAARGAWTGGGMLKLLR